MGDVVSVGDSFGQAGLPNGGTNRSSRFPDEFGDVAGQAGWRAGAASVVRCCTRVAARRPSGGPGLAAGRGIAPKIPASTKQGPQVAGGAAEPAQRTAGRVCRGSLTGAGGRSVLVGDVRPFVAGHGLVRTAHWVDPSVPAGKFRTARIGGWQGSFANNLWC